MFVKAVFELIGCPSIDHLLAVCEELVFSEVLWPDFGEPNFTYALYEFTQRERRFGAINSYRIDEN